MFRETDEELATAVGAANAAALAAEVERYLAVVVAFDDEGLSPFEAKRWRAALARTLPVGPPAAAAGTTFVFERGGRALGPSHEQGKEGD